LAIVLAVGGVLMAVLPFDRPKPRGPYLYSESSSLSCPAPIVSAWRHQPANSGWFGYAPLTSVPAPVESCAEAARRRLAYAGLLIAPGAVALFLRRRRLDPPTNPNPNLAT
jgi:hypothetical protein